MDAAGIYEILKVDLGELYPSSGREQFLKNCISAARSMIEREGIVLADTEEDKQLVGMYAAYLVRKRATVEPMPRMLRWSLNNRLFSQKAQEAHEVR